MADEQSAAADVVIVGGGFSGTMLAAQLARRGHRSLIIEKAGRAGEGTAFSTSEPAHLLNVRTEVMSAWPDRLDDFDGWLRSHPMSEQRARNAEYFDAHK